MSRRNSELFLAGQKLTRNYFLASQRTARWEGRRLHPGCLKLTGCRLKSCEGNPRETGETRREPLCTQLWCPVQKLWMSPEKLGGKPARNRRNPSGSNLQGRLGKPVRNKGEVGIPARRRGSCWSPETRLPESCSKFCGNPRDTWTVFRTSALALLGSVASWGASLCITLYIVAILAILTFLFVPLFPPSNLLPVLRCPTCDKASCGIRTHDLPLTERVLYQLS